MRNYRRLAATLLTLVLLGVAGLGAVLWREGYRVYVVHTGSMVPTFDPGDIVIDKKPDGHYHRGEVLTFLHSALSDDVVTHRVHKVLPNGLIETKGDANPTPDAWQIRPSQIEGQTIYSVRDLGYLLVYLRQPAGIGSLATAVLTIVLLWGLFFPPGYELEQRPARHRPRPDVRLEALPAFIGLDILDDSPGAPVRA